MALVLLQIPLVPLSPALSIVLNIYLMLKLSYVTWLRFTVWLILGECSHGSTIPGSPCSLLGRGKCLVWPWGAGAGQQWPPCFKHPLSHPAEIYITPSACGADQSHLQTGEIPVSSTHARRIPGISWPNLPAGPPDIGDVSSTGPSSLSTIGTGPPGLCLPGQWAQHRLTWACDGPGQRS